jgi:hypothetical protein
LQQTIFICWLMLCTSMTISSWDGNLILVKVLPPHGFSLIATDLAKTLSTLKPLKKPADHKNLRALKTSHCNSNYKSAILCTAMQLHHAAHSAHSAAHAAHIRHATGCFFFRSIGDHTFCGDHQAGDRCSKLQS